MKDSKIEWCDHTFNPWIGCTKVSPGCINCYAEAQNKRWRKGVNWGKGAPRQRTSVRNWKQPLQWSADAAERWAFHRPLSRPRVFCASLADWLDDEVPIEWVCNLLELVHATPALDWLLLTKRPENWQQRIESVLRFALENDDDNNDRHQEFFHWLNIWLNLHEAPANVWIGTTIEDQRRVDERIPELLKIPARVRFLSCEPLLEHVDLTLSEWPMRDGVDWVICGGESGPGARPMNEDWAESLRDQCAMAGVAFFMKQMGGVRDKRGDLSQIPFGLAVRQFPAPEVVAA